MSHAALPVSPICAGRHPFDIKKTEMDIIETVFIGGRCQSVSPPSGPMGEKAVGSRIFDS